MSSEKKEDSQSSDDEEEIVQKKLSKAVSKSFSDEDEEESSDSFEDSDIMDRSIRTREDRQIYEYDDDEVSFDYDEGSSSIDDLVDYEEEDEIMQVVVDEHGQANVAIVDDYGDIDDDEDVIAPLEDQSLKTEAEIGSEIFETSPYQAKEEIEVETPSLKTTLKSVMDPFVKATLLLGKSLDHELHIMDKPAPEDIRERSISTPSLHVDEEIKNITDTYVKVTNSLGRQRSRSESIMSLPSEDMSRKTVTYMKSSEKEISSQESLLISKEPHSGSVDKRSMGRVLQKLGHSMISITKRIGRSFSTNSLSLASQRRSSITGSLQQRSSSEHSLSTKHEDDQQDSINSKQRSMLSQSVEKSSLKSQSVEKSSLKSLSRKSSLIKSKSLSRKSSLVKSKSLSSIMDPDKTPDIGRGLQKITEDIILVTDCLRTSGQRRSSWSQETQIRNTGRVESKTASEISKDEKISEDENQSEMHSDAINDGRSDRSIGTLSKEKNEDISSTASQNGPPVKQDYHPFIKKILKREESMEVSKILIEAHNEDMDRERLKEEGMTFKNSLKGITNDILTVTKLLGTNPNDHTLSEPRLEEAESEQNLESDIENLENLKIVPPVVNEYPETPDIKLEIKKFTDDIVKVTRLLCHVRKEEIQKINPDVVYMRGGIDAMSCVTMEASPTK